MSQVTSDLTFIGTGISTSYTLIPLLQKLIAENKQDKLKTLTLIEKSDEHFTGVAYGKRTGKSVLLITSFADFLPEGNERQAFLKWLAIHKNELIKEFLEDGGSLSQNWYNVHKTEIENNDWLDIYLPRRFFGKYIKQKVENAITQFQTVSNLKINYITDEALDIDKNEDSYSIVLKNSEPVVTKKLVVSLGIPPINQLWNSQTQVLTNDYSCLINNPYWPSLDENISKIKSYLQENNSAKLLIVGANASAMEMLFKTNDLAEIRENISKTMVLSPQGTLPNSAQDDYTKSVVFIPENLTKLKQKDNLTALEIYNAALKDIKYAESKNYSAAISEVPVSKGFTSLLGKLSQDELINFACHYGNEIGKFQRRAGKHYTDVADKLKTENKLENLKGYFHEVILDTKNKQLEFSYKPDRKSDEIKSEKADIIINCVGGKMLNQNNIMPLIDKLITKGYCKANPSMRGFCVNEKMEASNNLYISGPLLAGNLVKGLALWHIEHCGRIIFLGEELANQLTKSL